MILAFSRTTDAAVIRRVLTDPAIYGQMSDDSTPAAEEFVPVENTAVWYVRVDDADELLGIFVLVPTNHVNYEIHTCLLPCAWGARAAAAGLGITQWFFANVPACQRIVTAVPSYNRLALRFARRGGMTEYGRNLMSFSKHQILYDQILLGLSRPQGVTCQY